MQKNKDYNKNAFITISETHYKADMKKEKKKNPLPTIHLDTVQWTSSPFSDTKC